MRHDNKTLDEKLYLLKAAAFYAKARATNDSKLKSAYEADAREYRYRAALLKQIKIA